MLTFRLASIALAALLPLTVGAQEIDIEATIEQSQSSAANRDLQAQAGAESPQTDDPQEIAIFHHKRGIANNRLGSYDRAIDDLRLALDNIQPKRPTPDGWGNRWRIQNDLADAYQGRGDWLSIIALWNSVAQEYQQSGLFNVHFAQLSLMDAYGLLGQWAAADQAREKAEAMLLRLRSTEGWTRNGFNALNQHNRLTAHFFAPFDH